MLSVVVEFRTGPLFLEEIGLLLVIVEFGTGLLSLGEIGLLSVVVEFRDGLWIFEEVDVVEVKGGLWRGIDVVEFRGRLWTFGEVDGLSDTNSSGMPISLTTAISLSSNFEITGKGCVVGIESEILFVSEVFCWASKLSPL